LNGAGVGLFVTLGVLVNVLVGVGDCGVGVTEPVGVRVGVTVGVGVWVGLASGDGGNGFLGQELLIHSPYILNETFSSVTNGLEPHPYK
jgi:hypothetical protein